MDSTYQIVSLTPELHASWDLQHLLVEAVELNGGAIFRGAYVPPPYEKLGCSVVVAPEEEPVLERLFAEACRRERPVVHGPRPKSAAKGITHSRNPVGTRSWAGRRA